VLGLAALFATRADGTPIEECPMNDQVHDLLDRVVYGTNQVDHLLALKTGTARRWIDGYKRSGKVYPPIVRVEATGEELVTWGEFVETRLLAEYRDAGVPIVHMRRAVEKLREEFNTRYPLAHARPFLDVEGKELVRRIQDETQLEHRLHLVVVRNNQVMLSPEAARFVQAVEYDQEIVGRLHPTQARHVVIDPLRHFGDPAVRNVPTEVIAELIRAGDSMEMVANLYDLQIDEVEDAVRYELIRANRNTEAAA
jgi:uncharacterized protein (DUF433 family)